MMDNYKLFIAQTCMDQRAHAKQYYNSGTSYAKKTCAYTLDYDGDGSLTWYMYAKLKHSSRSRRSPQPPHPLKPA